MILCFGFFLLKSYGIIKGIIFLFLILNLIKLALFSNLISLIHFKMNIFLYPLSKKCCIRSVLYFSKSILFVHCLKYLRHSLFIIDFLICGAC